MYVDNHTFLFYFHNICCHFYFLTIRLALIEIKLVYTLHFSYIGKKGILHDHVPFHCLYNDDQFFIFLKSTNIIERTRIPPTTKIIAPLVLFDSVEETLPTALAILTFILN